MQITKQQLIKWGACQDGLARFIEQTDTDQPVEVTLLIGGKNTASDLLY